MTEVKTDNTQCGRLLRRFKNGQTITSLSAYMLMNITQLGARLTELERKGYKFNKTWITLNSGTRVKQYSLKEDIKTELCAYCDANKPEEDMEYVTALDAFFCKNDKVCWNGYLTNLAINARDEVLEDRKLWKS